MKFPISTGLLVGTGELKGQRKEALKEIAKLFDKDYGMIHDVKIQNFVPQKNTALENRYPASKEQHLHAVETALSILPEDVTVTVPFDTTIDLEDFISAGIRDLGRVTLKNPVIRSKQTRTLESFSTYCEENGFQLLQRLALKRDFIVNNQYSKKLGQVFDNYKFKFKKDNQERLKQKFKMPEIFSHNNLKKIDGATPQDITHSDKFDTLYSTSLDDKKLEKKFSQKIQIISIKLKKVTKQNYALISF